MKIRTFPLSSLFFVTAIVVLLLATLKAWNDAAETRAKYQLLAAQFGYIERGDSSKTCLYRFINRDYRIMDANRSTSAESFRLQPADGFRYVLHVSEFATTQSTQAADLVPDHTVDLKDFRSNAVICCEVIRYQGPTPRVVVTADSETVLDVRSSAAWGNTTETAERWPDIPMAGYQELDPNQRIRFYEWVAPKAKRGLMFWLEPYDDWNVRQETQESKESEATTTDYPAESSASGA